MPEVRILSRDDVVELLDLAELRAALERALVAQAAGLADVPPRIAARTPNGFLAAMPGYLDLDGGLMATKLVSVFPGQTPSHQGLIAVFDAASGTPRCLMDGERITEDRTAMTAAIAADRLARTDADILTIIGAGAQGEAHVRCFADLRPWREIRVASRSAASARALVDHLDHPALVAIDEIDAAVQDADVVALCTHAGEPVIDPALVADGTHVSSVGSEAELPPSLADRAGIVVVDHLGAVSSPPPAGAAEVQHLTEADVVELGALVDGASGRPDAAALTVYKSTGHAVQDIAASVLVLDLAERAGLGVVATL